MIIRNSTANLSNESVLYDLSHGRTGVLIRLTSNDLTKDSTLPQLSSDDVPNSMIKLFIPSCEFIYCYTMA